MPDDAPSAGRRVSLFRNGRNQAVRIPRDLELPGEEAILRKEGDRLIMEPAPKTSLVDFLATLEPIEEELDFGDDPPPEPVEI